MYELNSKIWFVCAKSTYWNDNSASAAVGHQPLSSMCLHACLLVIYRYTMVSCNHYGMPTATNDLNNKDNANKLDKYGLKGSLPLGVEYCIDECVINYISYIRMQLLY